MRILKVIGIPLLFSPRGGNRRGFTLIEVLVATAVIVALALGIVSLQYIFGQSQLSIWRNYLNVDQANSNIQTMVRELRTAKTAENGVYPLAVVSNQEIIFYSDIDFDGKTEKVRYRLEGLNFSKGIIEPSGHPPNYPLENEKVKILTNNVRNGERPIFYYYNGGWPEDRENNPLPLADRLSETKLIRLYLRLNTEANEPDRDFILESYVQMRMLKENL